MPESNTALLDEMTQLFRLVAQNGGSDLHLLADQFPVIRINGTMTPQEHLRKLSAEDVKNLCYSLITPKQIERFDNEKELDFSYAIPDTGRFRVNLHMAQGTVGLVARLIPFQIPTIEQLGVNELAKRFVMLPQGLVLATGPAGMGKSTLLASMIEYVNLNASRHIITLEDPIEYVFESKKSFIRQRELGIDITSFKEGLRHVLRQDPNIIMIGEMRDLETIASALTLAETGHLILATLHTNSAAQSIDRIIDVFAPSQQDQVRLQLSMVLQAVITLKLLPSSQGGRIPAQEILIRNPAVANLIRSDEVSQLDRVIQTSRDEGMQSMDQSLAELYAAKRITYDTALTHVHDPSVLGQAGS